MAAVSWRKTLQYAKECPQIGTVVSLITSENEVSIRLHERFGFLTVVRSDRQALSLAGNWA